MSLRDSGPETSNLVTSSYSSNIVKGAMKISVYSVIKLGNDIMWPLGKF